MEGFITRAAGAPDSDWPESQVQLLLDTWLLTLFAVLLAVALPWFVNAFQIDFAAASAVLLALGALYVGLTFVSGLRTPAAAMRRRLLGLLNALGVIGLGVLWERSGGLQNPAFVLAFALPVVGASALSRWHPYATAVLAVLVTLAVALIQAPELRWYLAGAHGINHWLRGWFDGAAGGGAQGVLRGFYAPVQYDVVLLQVAAVLVLACAVASESLGNAFEKLLAHLREARAEAGRSQELWTRLVQELPLPALLLDAETRQILFHSRELTPFWPAGELLAGRGLFEVLQIAYPERLDELIGAEGGLASALMVRSGQTVRMARAHVRHIVYDARRLALVMLEDLSEPFCTAAALDTQEHPILVIDAPGRIRAANQAARALFPQISAGSEASHLLARVNGPGGVPRWWEPGLMGRRRLHVTLLRRTYLTTCTAVALPGEEQALYVVAFAPLLPAETAAVTPATATASAGR